RYIAPEQAEEGLWSAASDCYALGATLYQMLTGATPAPGDTLGDDTDPALARIVHSLLVRDPSAREADAVALGDELAAVAERLREDRLGLGRTAG
ncbi:MAG: hypothetical protein ABR591_11545, partial [Candidatus Velthaea sp.]